MDKWFTSSRSVHGAGGYLTGVRNPNTFPTNPVTLGLLDRSGDPIASIPPNGATTPADLMAAFGSATPALPVTIRALAEAPRPADVQTPIPVVLNYVVTV